MSEDWWQLDAVGLAGEIRDRRLDPVEIAEEALARAVDDGPTFIAVTGPRARREAEAARLRIRDGCPASPLDGVPIAWKDLFDMAGLPTTAGAEFRRHVAPAATDCRLVADAARAGLVAIGKTNLTELAFSGLGINPHFGTPVHPKDAGRVPGGSSSGSAVAVARHIVPLAMGSDTAGSVRIPAAFNDLFGYRPSIGRLSLDGVFPLAPSFDTAGPFARSLRDIVALDALLTGRAAGAEPPVPPDGRRIIVDEAILADARVEAGIRDAVERALEALGRAGATLERRRSTILSEAALVLERDGWLGGAEAFATHEALLAGPDAPRLDPAIRARLQRGGAMRLAAVVRLYQARDALARRLDAEATDAVFLMPAVGHAPPRLAEVDEPAAFAERNAATLRLTMIGSFLGMPGLTLPLGAGAGLLLTGPGGSDQALFQAARAIEAAGALD